MCPLLPAHLQLNEKPHSLAGPLQALLTTCTLVVLLRWIGGADFNFRRVLETTTYCIVELCMVGVDCTRFCTLMRSYYLKVCRQGYYWVYYKISVRLMYFIVCRILRFVIAAQTYHKCTTKSPTKSTTTTLSVSLLSPICESLIPVSIPLQYFENCLETMHGSWG